MYETLLLFHSWLRWLLLAALLFSLFRAYFGLITKRAFTKNDRLLRLFVTISAHLQLLAGFWLYFLSPITTLFLSNIGEAMKQKVPRFFGLEHSLLMIVAVILITIGGILVKRKKTDTEKFKAMAIYFTIALLLIFFAIPWEFSPFVNRPYFRIH